MKCRKCGKPIQFAEGAPWIRCVYCGAEYTRTAKKEKAGEVQLIGNGGNPLFEAFLPAGWTYRIIEDGSFSSLAPACLGIAFTGPGGVQMTFLPFAYYKDAAVRANPFSPQSVPGEQFDGMSLVRYRKRAALPQYAYERIAAITKTTQLRVELMDAGVLKEKAAWFGREAAGSHTHRTGKIPRAGICGGKEFPRLLCHGSGLSGSGRADQDGCRERLSQKRNGIFRCYVRHRRNGILRLGQSVRRSAPYSGRRPGGI